MSEPLPDKPSRRRLAPPKGRSRRRQTRDDRRRAQEREKTQGQRRSIRSHHGNQRGPRVPPANIDANLFRDPIVIYGILGLIAGQVWCQVTPPWIFNGLFLILKFYNSLFAMPIGATIGVCLGLISHRESEKFGKQIATVLLIYLVIAASFWITLNMISWAGRATNNLQSQNRAVHGPKKVDPPESKPLSLEESIRRLEERNKAKRREKLQGANR